MKKAGIIIIVIGIVLTIFTGFRFFTREKIVDMGDLQISRNKKHVLAWSPLVGLAVIAVGGGVYLLGTKRG
jgi:hypothetical protein